MRHEVKPFTAKYHLSLGKKKETKNLAGLHIAYISRLPHQSLPSTQPICWISCTGTQLTSAAPNNVMSSSAIITLLPLLWQHFLMWHDIMVTTYMICFVAQKSCLFWGSLEPAFCMSILDRNTTICLKLSNYKLVLY